jgi:DNA recombination protein RmuC
MEMGMDTILVFVALLIGVAIGVGIAWALSRGRLAQPADLAAARQEAENWREQYQNEIRNVAALKAQAERIPVLERDAGAMRNEISGLRTTNAQLQTQIEAQERSHAEKIVVLTQVRGEIERDLQVITDNALRNNQQSFVTLANEVFARHIADTDTSLDLRQKAVDALIEPIRTTLQAYQNQVAAMEQARATSQGELSASIRHVLDAADATRMETSKLSMALRAAPKTRGRWGEHSLRNVLELAGLNEYCDFATEQTFARDGDNLRPDVVVRLPGARNIVIDSKVSLTGYLDAIEATDEATRTQHMKRHADQIRSHVKLLADKSYWNQLTVTPDFVVMFIPGDNFYSAAVERDQDLFEDAIAQRVIIVTPTTLIALAKAIAFGWRQEEVSKNAKDVHTLALALYDRIKTMVEHIEACGDALGKSVKHYNAFIGSLEHRVMPQVSRFLTLKVDGKPIPALDQIDTTPRVVSVLGRSS